MNMPVKHDDFNGLVSESLKTTSRVIADKFEKRHDHVARDIRSLVDANPDWGVPNFGETPYVDAQNGQTYQMYEMTRDGYSMLVMGFTGKKAMEWKIKFLEAFNAMEAKLKSGGGFSLPQTYPEALRLAAEQAEQIELMKPKAAALDRLDTAEANLTIRPASKVLGYPERKLTKWLEANGWAFRQSGKGPLQAYVDKRNRGYLDHKLHSYEDAKTGDTETAIQLVITSKGLSRLAQILPMTGGAA